MKMRLCALLLLLALLLSACSGAESAKEQDGGPWYTAEERRLDFGEAQIFDLCLSGDRIWCCGALDERNVLLTTTTDGSEAQEIGDGGPPAELLEKLPQGADLKAYGLTTLLPGPEGATIGIGFLEYGVQDPGATDPERSPDAVASRESRLIALCVDGDGKIRFSYFLPEGWSYLRPCCDREGLLYLPLADPERIVTIDQRGQTIQTIQVPGTLSQLTQLADGSVAAVLYASNGLDLIEIDPRTGALGKAMNIHGLPSNRVYPGAFGWDALVNTGDLLYGIDLDGETGPILTWLNADLDGNLLLSIAADLDGKSATAILSPIGSVSVSREQSVVRLFRTDQPPVRDKTSLTLACMGLDSKVAEQVLRFNRKDDTYRIEVVDYSVYETAGAANGGVMRLNADIVSGRGPDLFVTKDLPVRSYVSQGLLEDLWPYIDADQTLGGRDALMLPVFDAMSQGGKLYQVAPGFGINTVIGPMELVGDRQGWSMEEFWAAWEHMPAGASVMEPWRTRLMALTTSMCMRVDDFVDRGKGSCRFDSEEFRELVRYTELFPAESNWDRNDTRNEYQRIIEHDQMLMQSYLYNFRSVTEETDFLRDQAVYVGLPGASGNGSSFEIASGIAMAASAEHKDGAWRFLRQLLDAEEQLRVDEQFFNAFPTNRLAFETLLEREMRIEYETLPDGSFALDAGGNKIPKSRGGRSIGENGAVLPVYPMTQAQANAFLALIDSTTCVRYWDDAVMDIVIEEIGAYYAGGRSLDAACANIQKRVTLYLQEQG